MPNVPTNGDDVLTGTAGNDTIDALAGNDTITSDRGTDTIIGNTGSDRLIVDYAANNTGNGIITNSFGVDGSGGFTGLYSAAGWGSVAFSTIEQFTITGSFYNDSITTGDGDDVVNASFGDDVVRLGKGTDSADGGGGGVDGVGKDFSAFGAGVTINLAAGTSTGTGGTYTNFEYFSGMVGSGFDDTFIGTASNANDTVDGGAGNDTASFLRGTDSFTGGSGNDRVILDYSGNNTGNGITSAALTGDVLTGYSGSYTVAGWGSTAFDTTENFTITGTFYNDSITTGDGNDVVNASFGDDVVRLGKGIDSADGGTGNTDGVGKDFSAFGAGVSINLGAGTSTGTGGTYTNFEYFAGMVGSAFDDTFLGTVSNANDTVDGGGGNDTASFLRGTDNFTGGGGTDRVIVDYSGNNTGNGITSSAILTDGAATAFKGTYTVAGWGSLTFGTTENITVTGTAYNDSVTTADGDDVVMLGSGDDVVRLGKGTDSADGGAGGVDGVGKDFSAFGAGVTINLGAGTSTGTGGTFTNFEYFSGMLGSAFDDTFLGTASTAGDSVDGGAGNDTASFLRGTDSFTGGAGNDRLIIDYSGNNTGNGITSAALTGDVLTGYSGSYAIAGWGSTAFDTTENFTITGTFYNDSITTGDGNDVVNASFGDDVVRLGKGIDSADGGTGSTDGVGKDFSAFAAGVSINLGAGTSTGTGGTYTNFEYFAGMVGSAFDDTFLGTASNANDTVDGGGGNDTASFLRGTDSFTGGAGTDRVIVDYSGNNTGNGIISSAILTDGAATAFKGTYSVAGWGSLTFGTTENITVTGTAYDDSVTTANGNDVVNLGSGNDVVRLAKGTDSADGGSGTDGLGKDFSAFKAGVTLDLATNISQNTGGSFTNFEYFAGIKGSGSADVFLGTAANSSDSVDGGAGNDTASFLRGTDSFIGGTGSDRLIVDYSGNNTGNGIVTSALVSGASGISGSYSVVGWGSVAFTTTEHFTVVGSAYNDAITTGSGDDILIGGGGNDTLTGGAGNDIYGIDSAGDVINEGVGSGTDAIMSSLQTSYNVAAGVANIEGYIYTGSAVFTGTGDANANIFGGGSNSDVLNGGGGIDKVTYLSAGAGVTVSLALQGGAQNTIGAGSDLLTGFENLEGSNFADGLTGDGTDNVLTGLSGNDVLEGGLGNDVLDGGIGNDTASYANAASLVKVTLVKTVAQATVGAGSDTLLGIENLIGSNFADTLTGDNGDNRLDGGGGNDVLSGGAGLDVLIGGSGLDSLTGGTQADVLTGGLGADKFIFKTLADSTLDAPDRITDFSHAELDKIDISAIDANLVLAGNQVFTFIGAAAFSGAGQVRAEVVGGDTQVTLDQNGDGYADMLIVLSGAPVLVGTDFVL